MVRVRLAFTCWLVIGFYLLTPPVSSAQDRLCDPSFENCYWPLLELVQKETTGIDMAFYMIELPGLVDAVISRLLPRQRERNAVAEGRRLGRL